MSKLKILANVIIFIVIFVIFRTILDNGWHVLADFLSAISWTLVIQCFIKPIRFLDLLCLDVEIGDKE